MFPIAPVDNLTAPLWHCLDFSKKQTERNVTQLGIDKVIHTRHQRTVHRLFQKQGTQRSETEHSSCSVLFMLLENRNKVTAYTFVSMHWERRTNVFITSCMWCCRCTYDLFYCKVANVQKFESYSRIILSATPPHVHKSDRESKNHKQWHFTSCTPLISRHLKIIPGFHYDLLSKQHTTTRYVL